MKFPVTRESLQAFTLEAYEEAEKEEEIQKKLAYYLNVLCNEFKQYLPRNSTIKQFVWFGLHLLPSQDKYLQQFINMVKDNFIGCDVTMNTARKYILIDWS